jgi:5-oxoprolinase (ATP-hydrolysing)
MSAVNRFRFSIDRGGTFTDVYAECPDGSSRVIKLLSEDPDNYPDAPREGIRRVLESVTGEPHPRGELVDTSRIEYIRMGTTVATNALLERRGERFALLITRGFKDLLHIGNQARPRIFDLEIKIPGTIYDRVVEIDERVRILTTFDEPRPDDVDGITGERVRVLESMDETAVRSQLVALQQEGINSVAVVLMHSYVFRAHEDAVGRIAVRWLQSAAVGC